MYVYKEVLNKFVIVYAVVVAVFVVSFCHLSFPSALARFLHGQSLVPSTFSVRDFGSWN